MISNNAAAHKSSDAYLSVQSDSGANQQTTMTIAVALRDIDLAIDSLDANDDRNITWGEVQNATPRITNWLSDDIQLDCEDLKLQAVWQVLGVQQRNDGHYLELSTKALCPQGAKLALTYRLLKDLDANHLGIVSGSVNQQQLVSILGGGAGETLQLRVASSASTVFLNFIPTGIIHIATGWDHLAFLFALLLPVLAGPLQTASTKFSFVKLLTTVTSFTVGHSITLALASFEMIRLSKLQAFWVEPLIALSIGVAALINLLVGHTVDRDKTRSAALALVFGLVHGLGFASVLQEASLSATLLPFALAGFNVGVEIGQIAAIAGCSILINLLSYQWPTVRKWSHQVNWGLLVVSIIWFVERLI